MIELTNEQFEKIQKILLKTEDTLAIGPVIPRDFADERRKLLLDLDELNRDLLHLEWSKAS